MSDRARAHLDLLGRIGPQLASTTTLTQVVDLTVDAALELLEADSVSVSVVEPELGMLRVLRNAGQLAAWEQQRPEDERYRITDFPRLAVRADQAAPWVANRDDPDAGPAYLELIDALGMDSSLSLPIVLGERIWGELGAARSAARRRFDAEDLPVGMALTALVSAAIGGLERQEELRVLAYHDPLTGLANRRAVDERLEAAFEPPGAHRIAVVLADVNGLKRVNDQDGHEAGDRVLLEVARLLSHEAARHRGSLAARLGGDEFCLVLEDPTEDELGQLTRRLTDAADRQGIADGLACGWARADGPPGGTSSPVAAGRALLRLADAEQYRAKRHGRGEPRSGAAHPERPQQVPVTELLAELAGLGDRVERLAQVARRVGASVDSAAWAVSVREHGGLEVVATDQRRDSVALHAPAREVEVGQYPATDRALRGGAISASLVAGDPTERGFLAANAYDELVAAGVPDGDRAWLVEIYGDRFTAPLAPLTGLLEVLVALAVAGASAGPRSADRP